MSDAEDRATRVRIRRAPKFSVFLILGAIIGVIVALILTASFPVDPTVGFGPTFGYLALYCVVIGVVIGALLALLFDRIATRRARTVTATVDYLQPEPDDFDDALDSDTPQPDDLP